MKTKISLALITVLIFTMALVGFTGQAQAEEDYLYIQVSMLSALDYFYDHQMGLEVAGEHMGVETRYMGPADADLAAMADTLEQAIAMNPDGLLVVGFDEMLNPIVNDAVAQGIPVVTLDSDLPGSDRLAFVGTGNFEAGYMGGQEMARLLDGEGQIGLLTLPGQPNLEERVDGYQAALEEYDIEIVQIANTESDEVVAASAASSILERFPNLDGIACVEAAGGVGAATAVMEAGRIGEVVIISMDRDEETLSYIEQGIITASIAQQTALMPYYGLQLMHNLNTGNVPEITSDNEAAGVTGTPTEIDTGVILVDENNYQYFQRD